MTCAMPSLWTALDERDHYTALHGNRTAGIALEIGCSLGLDQQKLEHLRIAAILHDIGKIGIPDSILLKPSTLDAREWEIMKTHSARGARILSARHNERGQTMHKEIVEAVRHHHEYFDGSGYPDGLKGHNIPLLARILCLVDGYDAMTTTRPYHTPLSHDQAMIALTNESARQADPQLLDVFQQVIAISCYRAS